MKYFEWDIGKNQKLKQTRGVTFEDVVFHIIHGGLPDIVEHPNKTKYPNQKIFILNIENYVYLVPFVEGEKSVFLKTIIPSRKMTKKYLGGRTR